MTYRISEIAATSPDMTADDFSQLIEDIRQHGQLVPIWMSGDEVIDGRKRLQACALLGIEPKAVDLSPDQDPAALVYSLNILRTHYTPSQRAMFAAKRAKWPKGKTKAQTAKFSGLDLTGPEAAKEAGVAESAVRTAKRILREGAPEGKRFPGGKYFPS